MRRALENPEMHALVQDLLDPPGWKFRVLDLAWTDEEEPRLIAVYTGNPLKMRKRSCRPAIGLLGIPHILAVFRTMFAAVVIGICLPMF